jgi:acetoin utilization protein AcuB
MSTPVITVNPDTPLEEAARIMADNKIGGLPVTRDGAPKAVASLVGIITETDIFKVLLELLGARVAGLRVTLAVREGKGVLAGLTRAIADLGANIVSLVTFAGDHEGERLITVKVSDVDAATLRQVLEGLNVRTVDFRNA